MIGQLPRTLEVGGVPYPIETDFRNILPILTAMNDPDLSDRQKLYIALKRLFRDSLEQIPGKHMEEAALQMRWFIDCGQEYEERKPSKRMIDWEQDEPVLFPAINKVAGTETRALQYLHWWTFMGYFMEIEDGVFSQVLAIRQKLAKGKALEKWEKEFYRNNKSMCEIRKRYSAEEQAEIDYWNKMLG